MDKNVENLIEYLNEKIVFNQPIEIPLEYTLVIKPKQELSNKIETFINEISKYDDRHVYYNKENLHATIYAPINIETDTKKLYSFLVKELYNKELVFDLRGISSSVIAVNPVNFSLFDFRRKILNFLGDSSRLKRASELELMAWINFVRFKGKPNNQYYNFIKKNYSISLGLFKPDYIEL